VVEGFAPRSWAASYCLLFRMACTLGHPGRPVWVEVQKRVLALHHNSSVGPNPLCGYPLSKRNPLGLNPQIPYSQMRSQWPRVN